MRTPIPAIRWSTKSPCIEFGCSSQTYLVMSRNSMCADWNALVEEYHRHLRVGIMRTLESDCCCWEPLVYQGKFEGNFPPRGPTWQHIMIFSSPVFERKKRLIIQALEHQHRFNSQPWEFGCAEFRVPIGKEWNTETWNGDGGTMPLKILNL